MHDRDRILDAVDLPALADELLGPRHGHGMSTMWRCPSATHTQTGRTPPVSIFTTNRGEQRWHCHGCGIGGTAVDLVIATHNVGVRDALEYLASRVGIGATAWDVRRPRWPSRPTPAPARAVADPGGLAAYIDECAERLWRPDGRPVLRWLTRSRGLAEEVLYANRIGADPGRRGQPRPDGMPAGGWAAVLPVFDEGRPVFAQLRSLAPFAGRPKYLNAANRLAPNPRVALYHPSGPASSCIVVTEGVLDALSATLAGYRAAAVFGAALAGIGTTSPRSDELVERLQRAGARFAVAFDADPAGERGAVHVVQLLCDRGAHAIRVPVPAEANDLNAWMRTSPDWPLTLRTAVRAAAIDTPRCEQPARRLGPRTTSRL